MLVIAYQKTRNWFLRIEFQTPPPNIFFIHQVLETGFKKLVCFHIDPYFCHQLVLSTRTHEDTHLGFESQHCMRENCVASNYGLIFLCFGISYRLGHHPILMDFLVPIVKNKFFSTCQKSSTIASQLAHNGTKGTSLVGSIYMAELFVTQDDGSITQTNQRPVRHT